MKTSRAGENALYSDGKNYAIPILVFSKKTDLVTQERIFMSGI